MLKGVVISSIAALGYIFKRFSFWLVSQARRQVSGAAFLQEACRQRVLG
jgi:hypothetical protein